jgi:KAP family P-loop domain
MEAPESGTIAMVAGSSADVSMGIALHSVLDKAGLDVALPTLAPPRAPFDIVLLFASELNVSEPTLSALQDVARDDRLVVVALDRRMGGLPFRVRSRFDLSGWTGDPGDKRLEQLIGELTSRMGLQSVPSGATKTAQSEFPEFQSTDELDQLPSLSRLSGELLDRVAIYARARGATFSMATNVLLGTLQWLISRPGAGSTSAALLHLVPEARIQEVSAAVDALIQSPTVGPAGSDYGITEVIGQAQRLAERLKADATHPHHIVAAALAAGPIDPSVFEMLNISQAELAAELRAEIAKIWPTEPAEIWDEELGPIRREPSPELNEESTLLLGWADAIRQAAGREEGEPLDAILGVLAAARANLNRLPDQLRDPAVAALVRSLESPDRPLSVVLAEALASVTVPPHVDPAEAAQLARYSSEISLATSIAEQTTSAATVSQRHLLAASLVTSRLPDPLLAALHCDGTELRLRLRSAIADRIPDDDLHAWDSVLGLSQLESPFTSDHVPVANRRRGDALTEPLPDQLNFDAYVTMLATMIARKSTAMPVSIGLFGEWGSGKSYFMELLRQKVETLAAGGGPYLREIVPITFNAWSYADTNLWASLAAEFFEQLGAPEVDPDDQRRAAIQDSLKQNNQIRVELSQIRATAATRTKEARDSYAKAVLDRTTKARTFNFDLITAVAADPIVRSQLAELSNQLGFAKEDRERTLQIATDVQGISDDAAATRRVLAQRSLRLPFILLLIAITLVGAVLLLPSGTWSWLTGTGALATLAAFLTTLGVIISKSRAIVGQLRNVAGSAQQVQARLLTEDEVISEQAEGLHQAETDEALAEARLHDLDAAIAELDRQLLELEPGRRLYRFIAERAGSNEYRNQLGVVSLVRRDFDQLVKLMSRWRDAPASNNGEQLRPIDRIVLYIDDLDRCDPEQVVNVLQAVHLLLAMPLFVVVVGVDPRWLLRALRTRYQGILGEGAVDESDESLGFAESTPQNYLEKIFQVPFVLPEMDSKGFDQLIRSMAGHSHTAQPDAPERPLTPLASELEAAPQSARVAGSRPPQVAPIVPENHSEVSEVMQATDKTRPETVAKVSATPLTRGELKLLSLLAPLVRTPRAATRLFNVYGLLRSARNLSPGSQFLGGGKQPGDYQAVAQLLGILTGTPQLLGPMLWGRSAEGEPDILGLCRMDGQGSWASFVDSLKPTEVKEYENRQTAQKHQSSSAERTTSWSNAVAAEIDADEVEAWQRLVSELQQIRSHIELDDLSRYRMWGPQVARFSFLLSSFATTD